MAKPRKIAAPKSTIADDLAKLAKATRARGGQPAAIRRAKTSTRRSQNPSRVPIDQSLRVQRQALPTAEELLRQTSTTLGEGRRQAATPLPPTSTPLPSAADLLELTGGAGPLADLEEEGEERVDRTEVISPPPSLDPARPRALEASYNPDSRVLTVDFRNGGTYAYFGVPPQTWRALKNNRSFGQTLDRLVINRYQYEKVAF